MEMHVKVRVTIATSQDKKEAAMTVLNGHVVVSCNLSHKKFQKVAPTKLFLFILASLRETIVGVFSHGLVDVFGSKI